MARATNVPKLRRITIVLISDYHVDCSFPAEAVSLLNLEAATAQRGNKYDTDQASAQQRTSVCERDKATQSQSIPQQVIGVFVSHGEAATVQEG